MSVFFCAFHLPASLGSTGVNRLLSYYECSDFPLTGSSPLPTGDEHRPVSSTGDPCLTSRDLLLVRSPTTFRRPRAQPVSCSRSCCLSPFRRDPVCLPDHGLWTSPCGRWLVTTTGRIEFTLHYRPRIRFQLLSTPPCDDAVTFSYRVQVSPEQGLPPCRYLALTGARPRPSWPQQMPANATGPRPSWPQRLL